MCKTHVNFVQGKNQIELWKNILQILIERLHIILSVSPRVIYKFDAILLKYDW